MYFIHQVKYTVIAFMHKYIYIYVCVYIYIYITVHYMELYRLRNTIYCHSPNDA